MSISRSVDNTMIGRHGCMMASLVLSYLVACYYPWMKLTRGEKKQSIEVSKRLCKWLWSLITARNIGNGKPFFVSGNGNLFPENTFAFPNIEDWKRKLISRKQVSVSKNLIPPPPPPLSRHG